MPIGHQIPAGLPTGTSAGKVAGDDWRASHLHIPFQQTLFHGGPTGVWTAPTAATTNTELATAPMSRLYTDLDQAAQARLVIGMRTLGVGYTTAVLRLQYAAVAQSTWTELAATAGGGDVSLLAGTANIIRVSPWFTIAAAALATDQVLRLVFNSTGTGTTAATVAFADLLLK